MHVATSFGTPCLIIFAAFSALIMLGIGVAAQEHPHNTLC